MTERAGMTAEERAVAVSMLADLKSIQPERRVDVLAVVCDAAIKTNFALTKEAVDARGR